jgi:seryl-tRNA synthetase
MVVENNGTIINLREKFLEYQKKKGNISSASQSQSSVSLSKDVKAESRNLADVIAIKKENILASGTAIRKDDDAEKLLNELKNKFENEPNEFLNAHKKADANRILRFYPFD